MIDELKRMNVTARDWLRVPSYKRGSIKVRGFGLRQIARFFGIAGSPIESNNVHYELCRAIFGDAEVDQALQELGKGARGK